MPAAAMQVIVNGQPRPLAPGTTIAALVAELGVRRGAFAVELNRKVVPAAHHGEQQLADGDVVEVVTFVGGG